ALYTTPFGRNCSSPASGRPRPNENPTTIGRSVGRSNGPSAGRSIGPSAGPSRNMSHLQFRVVTHTQKVCALYKKALRLIIEQYYHDIALLRYHSVHLRRRFELNRDIQDVRLAKKLLEEGWKEAEKYMTPWPIVFPHSPGGVAYERRFPRADYIIDYWHPLEKAMFPDYFARREQRKKEYIEFYKSQYSGDGPPGVAYERRFPRADYIIDYWHPLEKAMFPDYFARREQRKKEYIEFYKSQYSGDGPPGPYDEPTTTAKKYCITYYRAPSSEQIPCEVQMTIPVDWPEDIQPENMPEFPTSFGSDLNDNTESCVWECMEMICCIPNPLLARGFCCQDDSYREDSDCQAINFLDFFIITYVVCLLLLVLSYKAVQPNPPPSDQNNVLIKVKKREISTSTIDDTAQQNPVEKSPRLAPNESDQ
ncbi:unnamed protein product, partial [Cyprideis torosa]